MFRTVRRKSVITLVNSVNMKVLTRILRQPPSPLTHRFTFSTKLKDVEKALCQNIKTEIAGEEFDVETDTSVKQYLTKNGWKLSASDQSTRMVLSKTVDDYKVKIYFEAKLPDANQSAEEGQEGQEGQEGGDYLDFSVVLDRNRPSKLFASLYFTEGEVYVNELFFSPQAEDIAERKVINLASYGGPSIETLEEELQAKINQYLAGVGVTAELAEVISQSSVLHESKLYKNYLEEFKAFLE